MSEPAPGFVKHPSHQVDITATTDHVRILVNETVIADTTKPLKVLESRHQPVWYLPLKDVNVDLLVATEHTTYCPFKGHASYWSIDPAQPQLENSVWGYQEPYVECEPLRNHVAFYTDKVALEVNGEFQNRQGPGWSS